MEKVSFESDGVVLEGCFCAPQGGSEEGIKTICVAHGLPFEPKPIEEKGYPDLANMLCKNGYSSLVFNFRGTSNFGGEFGFLEWAEDLSNAISYLLGKKNVDPRRLIVLGFSAGAMVSCFQAARDDRIKGVILCCCPDRIDKNVFRASLDMGKKTGTIKFSDIEHVITGMDKVDPKYWIQRISIPLLLVHGRKDPIASIDGAKTLFKLSNTQKTIKIIEEEGHQLRQNEDAMNYVFEWIKAF
ncbi:MAG: prolyl oligopeptidase family serine peptidase [Halobacteriota archaeon]|nr:prolyl oligopeptidase family serine peptidase [Halobacteriota archaeon]